MESKVKSFVNQVLGVIQAHPFHDSVDIKISTKHGLVTLKGWVETEEQRTAVQKAIEQVKGVIDVRNDLKVKAGRSRNAQAKPVGKTEAAPKKTTAPVKSTASTKTMARATSAKGKTAAAKKPSMKEAR